MEFIFGGGGDLFGGYFMVSIIVQSLWHVWKYGGAKQ